MTNASQDALQALAQALRGAADERMARLGPIARDFQEVEPHPDSPPREILVRLGDRWSSLLLVVLATGQYRHNELQRVVSILAQLAGSPAISHRMLTLRARALERDGLVSRSVGTGKSPPVEYGLTPMGASLLERLRGLIGWAGEHAVAIREAQQAFDQRDAPPRGRRQHRLR